MKKFVLSLCFIAFSISCFSQGNHPSIGKSIGRWKDFGLESMKENKAGGLEYIEVAMNNVISKDPATAHVRAEQLKKEIGEAGLKVWSVHLPYSRTLDISVLDDSLRALNVQHIKDMMRVAGIFGAKYHVLHPSSEPIAACERELRLENSRRSIGELAQVAEELGIVLCVENLPRTCLGRNGEEMMRLIDGYDNVGLCFDTNHLLFQSHEDYLEAIGKGRIKTVHLSDYDFKDERHWIPGKGHVQWPEVWKGIRENGYEGIMMFEAYGEPEQLDSARNVLLGTMPSDKLPPSDSSLVVNAEWEVEELGRGAVKMYAELPLFHSRQSISVIRYPARKFRTAMLHRPGREAGTVDRLAEAAGAEFGINASYFDMKKLVPTVYFRVGDEVYGHTAPNELFRLDGLVAFKDRKGRKIMIAASDTTEYERVAGKCHSVMVSGPLLVDDGKTVVPVLAGDSRDIAGKKTSYADFHDKRHPRTVIGLDGRGHVYFVVIDGRLKGKADGTSVYETAQICRWLGMTEALNLDGGGSSTIWSDRTGIINHPSDNKTFDHDGARTVPNLIVAY